MLSGATRCQASGKQRQPVTPGSWWDGGLLSQPGSRQECVFPPLAGISAITRPPLSLSEPMARGSRWEIQVPGGKSSREPGRLGQQGRFGEGSTVVQKSLSWASLAAQWWRVRQPMQETWVRLLIWEEPTCHGATGPARHSL